MKQLLLLCAAMVLSMGHVQACDVCGCAAGNQYLGLLPEPGLHFVGVQYQYNSFEAKHPSLFAGRPDEESRIRYNTLQLWGRYAIGNRVQLYGFVPWRYNVQHADTNVHRASGISDVSVMAGVVLLNKSSQTTQHQLFAAAGSKLPTGQYIGIAEADQLGLPNLQPGTGSFDFLLNANYTLRYNRYGMNVDASYTFTTANRDSYKYGNRLSTGLMLFRTFGKRNADIIPQLGARYEYTLHDYDNYPDRWLNEQTGGYMAFASAGLQAYYNKTGVRLMGNLPIAQQYSKGYVQSKQRLEISVFYLF